MARNSAVDEDADYDSALEVGDRTLQVIQGIDIKLLDKQIERLGRLSEHKKITKAERETLDGVYNLLIELSIALTADNQ